MSVLHMEVPAVIGSILQSAFKFTKRAIAAYSLSGRLIYANPSFWVPDRHDKENSNHLKWLLGPDLWDLWHTEARLVLNSGQPMRYIADVGISQDGRWVTSRCAGWSPDVYGRHVSYVEVLPVSRRRGIVVRTRESMSEILALVPADAEFHHDTTMSEKL